MADSQIILTTLNARYTHTSIGLRYLFANLEELQENATILEFVINDNVQDIVEKLLQHQPKIIGIGVYIWNVLQVRDVLEIIKKVSPETVVILGGPEVSYSPLRVNMDAADFIVQGEGDIAFYALSKAILEGNPPAERIIKADIAPLESIKLPYQYYTDEDVKNRYIYVEASRGCPFKCEFCLSSMDNRVRDIFIDGLIEEFEILWQRGARSFKFIDRTFNLNMKVANKLLDFFLSRDEPYFAHFEVIPDHFPASIKEKIALFPAASLQLEVGIQTLNVDVAANIHRKLKMDKIKENIRFLEEETQAHMHLDLIVGLPGEDLESFGQGLNQLCSLTRSEIQIGILKNLSGTSLSRHNQAFGMIYSDQPPYDVLQNNLLSYENIQSMKRFARFWNLYYNSGNFNKTLPHLWPDGDVFHHFYHFSVWIYQQTQSTWKISLDRLAKLIFQYLTDVQNLEKEDVAKHVVEDFMKIEGRVLPNFLRPYAPITSKIKQKKVSGHQKRQIRHT